jgi:iron-sulfur cluster repair protein YtfE (RIC family)
MAYACGGGESIHAQAAEEQMYAIAMNNFAKRINSEVNSATEIKFDNDKKTTRTVISYVVKDTTIREHLRTESAHFTMAGRHYSFVRLEMPKAKFDELIAEAKAQKVAKAQ